MAKEPWGIRWARYAQSKTYGRIALLFVGACVFFGVVGGLMVVGDIAGTYPGRRSPEVIEDQPMSPWLWQIGLVLVGLALVGWVAIVVTAPRRSTEDPPAPVAAAASETWVGLLLLVACVVAGGLTLAAAQDSELGAQALVPTGLGSLCCMYLVARGWWRSSQSSNVRDGS